MTESEKGLAIVTGAAGGMGAAIARAFAAQGRPLILCDLRLHGPDDGLAVIEQLRNNYAPITELRSAVIWTKACSVFQPDYSVEFLPTNPWIHQPFESYDSLRPQDLLARRQQPA